MYDCPMISNGLEQAEEDAYSVTSEILVLLFYLMSEAVIQPP